MNTPAHLIFGTAFFARPARAPVLAAALAGAMLPDASLYVLVGWALLVQHIPPQIVFNELYFSDTWQSIFAVDNSALLWGAALGVGVWRRSALWIAFAGAGLLHIGLDFALHHDDGRSHFWPLTNWVFASPVSYWDRGHGAGLIAPLEGLACIALTGVLLRRFTHIGPRVLFVALLGAELFTIRNWLVFF